MARRPYLVPKAFLPISAASVSYAIAMFGVYKALTDASYWSPADRWGMDRLTWLRASWCVAAALACLLPLGIAELVRFVSDGDSLPPPEIIVDTGPEPAELPPPVDAQLPLRPITGETAVPLKVLLYDPLERKLLAFGLAGSVLLPPFALGVLVSPAGGPWTALLARASLCAGLAALVLSQALSVRRMNRGS